MPPSTPQSLQLLTMVSTILADIDSNNSDASKNEELVATLVIQAKCQHHLECKCCGYALLNDRTTLEGPTMR
jgi:hypothetical protein